jgi:DNA-binding MarR family transcriptional regulator
MDLDKKLAEVSAQRTVTLIRLAASLKRQYDQWLLEMLAKQGYDDIKTMHMLFLININPEGTNNCQLAKLAFVTKQAMSKVTKELLELGYIHAKIDEVDKRSAILKLTDRGKSLVITIRLTVMELMEEYKVLVGRTEFDTTIQTLLKIIEFNNERLKLN